MNVEVPWNAGEDGSGGRRMDSHWETQLRQVRPRTARATLQDLACVDKPNDDALISSSPSIANEKLAIDCKHGPFVETPHPAIPLVSSPLGQLATGALSTPSGGPCSISMFNTPYSVHQFPKFHYPAHPGAPAHIRIWFAADPGPLDASCALLCSRGPLPKWVRPCGAGVVWGSEQKILHVASGERSERTNGEERNANICSNRSILANSAWSRSLACATLT